MQFLAAERKPCAPEAEVGTRQAGQSQHVAVKADRSVKVADVQGDMIEFANFAGDGRCSWFNGDHLPSQGRREILGDEVFVKGSKLGDMGADWPS